MTLPRTNTAPQRESKTAPAYAPATGAEVPVLADKRVSGWPRKSARSRVPGPAEYMQIGEALSRDFDTDAHFQAVSVPSTPHRLRKASLSKLQDGVAIVAMVFDVDQHDLTGDALDEWWDDQQEAIDRMLSAQPGAYVYRTKHGYRIVYLLPASQGFAADDGKKWHTFYERSALYLSRFGLRPDHTCKDWTRLYRLPHATRDAGAGPERRETFGDPNAIGAWSHRPGPDCLDDDIDTAERLRREYYDQRPGTHKASPYGPILRTLREIKNPPVAVPAPPVAPRAEVLPSAKLDVRGILWCLVDRVAKLTVDSERRNYLLNTYSYTLHGLAAPEGAAFGQIDPDEIDRLMLQACERNGYAKDPNHNADGVLHSARDDGNRTPVRSFDGLRRYMRATIDPETGEVTGMPFPPTAVAAQIDALPGKLISGNQYLILRDLGRLVDFYAPKTGHVGVRGIAERTGISKTAVEENLRAMARKRHPGGQPLLVPHRCPNVSHKNRLANSYELPWLRVGGGRIPCTPNPVPRVATPLKGDPLRDPSLLSDPLLDGNVCAADPKIDPTPTPGPSDPATVQRTPAGIYPCPSGSGTVAQDEGT